MISRQSILTAVPLCHIIHKVTSFLYSAIRNHALQLFYYTCCIHQRNDADQMYLRCCPVRAWTRLRCLEGVREW